MKTQTLIYFRTLFYLQKLNSFLKFFLEYVSFYRQKNYGQLVKA